MLEQCLTDRFPERTMLLDDWISAIEIICTQKQAFTGFDRQSGRVIVRVPCRGTIGDALLIAHEMGHALQYHLCGARFITPMNREFCAFVTEQCFVKHIEKAAPGLYPLVIAASAQDDDYYLTTCARSLTKALENENSPYEYGFNYPLARIAAVWAAQTMTPDALWRVFLGDHDVAKLLHQIEIA